MVGFPKEKHRNQDSSILCPVHVFGTQDLSNPFLWKVSVTHAFRRKENIRSRPLEIFLWHDAHLPKLPKKNKTREPKKHFFYLFMSLVFSPCTRGRWSQSAWVDGCLCLAWDLFGCSPGHPPGPGIGVQAQASKNERLALQHLPDWFCTALKSVQVN